MNVDSNERKDAMNAIYDHVRWNSIERYEAPHVGVVRHRYLVGYVDYIVKEKIKEIQAHEDEKTKESEKACMRSLENGGGKITKLQIYTIRRITPWSQLPYCYKFKGVFVSPKSCELIARHCSALLKASIHCPITDKAVEALCSTKSIKSLKLQYCDYLSIKAIKSLSQIPELESLTLATQNPYPNDSKINKGLKNLKDCSKLKTLTIENFSRLTNKTLLDLIKCLMPHAKRLVIRGRNNITLDSTIKKSIKGLKREDPKMLLKIQIIPLKMSKAQLGEISKKIHQAAKRHACSDELTRISMHFYKIRL